MVRVYMWTNGFSFNSLNNFKTYCCCSIEFGCLKNNSLKGCVQFTTLDECIPSISIYIFAWQNEYEYLLNRCWRRRFNIVLLTISLGVIMIHIHFLSFLETLLCFHSINIWVYQSIQKIDKYCWSVQWETMGRRLYIELTIVTMVN